MHLNKMHIRNGDNCFERFCALVILNMSLPGGPSDLLLLNPPLFLSAFKALNTWLTMMTSKNAIRQITKFFSKKTVWMYWDQNFKCPYEFCDLHCVRVQRKIIYRWSCGPLTFHSASLLDSQCDNLHLLSTGVAFIPDLAVSGPAWSAEQAASLLIPLKNCVAFVCDIRFLSYPEILDKHRREPGELGKTGEDYPS